MDPAPKSPWIPLKISGLQVKNISIIDQFAQMIDSSIDWKMAIMTSNNPRCL